MAGLGIYIQLPFLPKPKPWSKAAGVIGLHVNADKMEYMCFNQKGESWFYEISGQVHLPRKHYLIY